MERTTQLLRGGTARLMKKLGYLLFANPVAIFTLGGVIVLIGELIGASNPKPDDTISEKFEDFPDPLKAVVYIFFGMLLAHFMRWMAPIKTTTNVLAQPGSSVEVNEAK